MDESNSALGQASGEASGLGASLSRYWTQAKKFVGDKYRQHVSGVLKCGPVPRHIAFIMDGNRRYARRLHEQISTGHSMGGETLLDVRPMAACQWSKLHVNLIPDFCRLSSGAQS